MGDPAGAVALVILVAVLVGAVFGALCSSIWEGKGGSSGAGFALGFFLGLIGLLYVGFATPSRRTAAVGQHVPPTPPAAAPPPRRECPFCLEQIRREASVCPHCRRESPPWSFAEGRWWVTAEDGIRRYRNESTGEWFDPGEDPTASALFLTGPGPDPTATTEVLLTWLLANASEAGSLVAKAGALADGDRGVPLTLVSLDREREAVESLQAALAACGAAAIVANVACPRLGPGNQVVQPYKAQLLRFEPRDLAAERRAHSKEVQDLAAKQRAHRRQVRFAWGGVATALVVLAAFLTVPAYLEYQGPHDVSVSIYNNPVRDGKLCGRKRIELTAIAEGRQIGATWLQREEKNADACRFRGTIRLPRYEGEVQFAIDGTPSLEWGGHPSWQTLKDNGWSVSWTTYI